MTDYVLDSIEKYNPISSTAKESTLSLQKQLINYKLQHKILQDLLQKALNGDQGFTGQLSPIIIHPIIDKLLDSLESVIGDHLTKTVGESTLQAQIVSIRSESDAAVKLQRTVMFFEFFAREIVGSVANLRAMFKQQAEKMGYLRYLVSGQLQQSQDIVSELSFLAGEEQSSQSNLQLSRLSGTNNELSVIVHEKDDQLHELQDKIVSLGKMKKIQEELAARKAEEWKNKYKEVVEMCNEKDAIIAQLRAQLGQSTPPPNESSEAKTNELNRRLEELNSLYSTEYSDKQIQIVSNFDEDNLIENNLVETISLLNSKLIEKNSLFEKLSSSIQIVNKEHNELMNDRLTLKKTIMSQQSQINALTEKVDTINQNLHSAVSNFHILLSLNIDTYTFFCSVIDGSFDQSSFTQVKAKIQKLDKLNSKSLNFDKIFYYAQAVHRYFEDIVEALATDHRKVVLDSEEKQRMDGDKIKELTETNNALKKSLSRMKAEFENTAALRDQISQLRVENNEIRQLSMSSQRALMSPEDSNSFNQSLKTDSRVEEVTKRWKAERERRALDHRNSQKTILALEEETEYLKKLLER